LLFEEDVLAAVLPLAEGGISGKRATIFCGPPLAKADGARTPPVNVISPAVAFGGSSP
jgi:hypothetical protein